jgi:hypothetical protein
MQASLIVQFIGETCRVKIIGDEIKFNRETSSRIVMYPTVPLRYFITANGALPVLYLFFLYILHSDFAGKKVIAIAMKKSSRNPVT